LKEQLTIIKQKVAIHNDSDYKGFDSFEVVSASYQIDFEAQSSISIVNKRQLFFA